MTILDYNLLKKQYRPKCELIYTDTDNLLLEIQTDDVYKDMEESKYHFDTSDCPKDHPLHSSANKKVLGKSKDETNGTPIVECVCLPPEKIYSIFSRRTITSKSQKAQNLSGEKEDKA